MTPEEAAESLINGNISTVIKWLKTTHKVKLILFMEALRQSGIPEQEVFDKVKRFLEK
jgi:hypothetical protein